MAQVFSATVEPDGGSRSFGASSRSQGQARRSHGQQGQHTDVLRAAAYCRVSTLSEDQEGSYELQVRSYEEKINADPNLTLVRVYGDRGISGGDAMRRKQFQEMIRDCRAGKIDIIYTKSISRFARNLSDTVTYTRELKELGIPILFEKENINSMDPSTELLLDLLAAAAQEELNDLSQNVKWSQEKARSEGNPKFNACYGYRKCMEGGQCVWKICEPEAERVRFAFQMAEEGKMYWQILEELQQMEDDEGTGAKWNFQRLRAILSHEAYIGNLIVGKTVRVDCVTKKSVHNHGEYPMYYIENHHEPLISEKQFTKVQENIQNNVLRSRNFAEVPDRWKSAVWKRKNGQNRRETDTARKSCRWCYSKSRGGKKDERDDRNGWCIYGRTDCPGWPGKAEAGGDCDGKP